MMTANGGIISPTNHYVISNTGGLSRTNRTSHRPRSSLERRQPWFRKLWLRIAYFVPVHTAELSPIGHGVTVQRAFHDRLDALPYTMFSSGETLGHRRKWLFW